MNTRIADGLIGLGCSLGLAFSGVATERIYGDTDVSIASLAARVSRLENLLEYGGIHIEGGRAEVHVNAPTEAELHHQRVQQNAYARWLATYGKETADAVLLHSSAEAGKGSGARHVD